jgi:two-component system sensor histidine kinase UhpB
MKPMMILIIDDNSEDRSAYRRFLEPFGSYVIHEAEDGEIGLDMARRLRPNCILLGLKLKDQSGLEILVKLMDETSTSTIPVIMISTGIAKVVVDAALSFGASHFLIKGKFDAMALDSAIRESLAKSTNQ